MIYKESRRARIKKSDVLTTLVGPREEASKRQFEILREDKRSAEPGRWAGFSTKSGEDTGTL